jgi:hypothetical protein
MDENEMMPMVLNVTALLSLRKVRKMNYHETGLLLQLLILQWEFSYIPEEIGAIAEELGVLVDEIAPSWAVVKKCFVPYGNGRLINQYLELEKNKLYERRQRNRENGQKGGRTKATKVGSKAAAKHPAPSLTPVEEGFGNPGLDAFTELEQPFKGDLEEIIAHAKEASSPVIPESAFPTKKETEEKRARWERRKRELVALANGEIDSDPNGYFDCDDVDT